MRHTKYCESATIQTVSATSKTAATRPEGSSRTSTRYANTDRPSSTPELTAQVVGPRTAGTVDHPGGGPYRGRVREQGPPR
ncbi:hypothetical protein Vau01_050620 [Virgisporangium aurantiacum]|uniref:Uncharacterized protein n=1 Tax=Virgisporangium aurantiacum TaxID=175570 RepID=A0A8J3Z9B3_9ACTN|nr:hypothetical protein Vau01_050620 [Virgisporangium aurantiacum]